MSESVPSNQCAAYGCQNKRSEGVFVGDFCGPCDSALRYGTATYGTSFIFQQQREIERLQRELAQHKEDAYERALDLKHFIAERDRLRGDLAETRIALANAEMRLRHHGLLPADEEHSDAK